MKKIYHLLITLMIIYGIEGSTHAELIDRGGGLIYDTDLNITWLQDANYANTTGYDDTLYGINTDGSMRWGDAMVWADNLVYQGYDDWRLPVTPNPCYAFNCIDSEMGHLYYIELGNPAGGLTNDGPFINIRPGAYWSSTNSANGPWYFPFSDGSQGVNWQNPRFYVWAVRDGDSYPITASTISGFVTDPNHLPIEGAVVKLRHKGIIVNTTRTDVNGYYEFKELGDGRYMIISRKAGYNRDKKIGRVTQSKPWSKEEFINLVLTPGVE